MSAIKYRSLCSVVCKWNFDAENNEWSSDYFRQIGIPELIEGSNKIGTQFHAPGSPISGGLSKWAAVEFDLLPGTAVGVSMIDAHAGAAAMFGCSAVDVASDVTSKLGNTLIDTNQTRNINELLLKHLFAEHPAVT